MISSKHIDKAVVAFIVIATILCVVFPGLLSKNQEEGSMKGTTMEYETKLFDTTKAAEINIVIDQDKWNGMLENAAEKKWNSCDVVVNGTTFHDVAIRTKGDNSLEGITENPDSNRYSFKLEFDKYNEGQTCFGLDKLCLNNNYGDATSMKEALIYDMFQYMGGQAPLYNYAQIMVNGEYWGVYLILEAVEDSFLTRNYGEQKGALYKPGKDMGDDNEVDMDEWGISENEETNPGDIYEEGTYSGGADLNYTGDNLKNYELIFKCDVNKTDKSDHRRIVRALKNISEKKDLETYMDMDNILKYMAIHNFSVNYDSLLGDGDHNYYLYEADGKLSFIPWDYNLCLGAYQCELNVEDLEESTSATSVINKSIDDSWPMTSFFDGILENEEYREKYHQYYQKLIDEYVLGNGFERFYTRTRNVIDYLIKTDPSALYEYNTYNIAAKTLRQTVLLRGQSVKGQLNGSIPSTLQEQKLHTDKLVDGSGINLYLMGGDGGMEEAEFAENEAYWTEYYKNYLEQITTEKKNTQRRNGITTGLLFIMMILVCMFIRFRKREL